MHARVTTLETRTNYIEKTLDRLDRSICDLRNDMDNRFAQVDAKFVQLEDKIDKRFIHFEEKMDKRFEKIDRKFYWIIGIQFTSVFTMIAYFAKVTNQF